MKLRIVLAAAVALSAFSQTNTTTTTTSTPPAFGWALGSEGSGNTGGISVCADGAGNSIVVGNMQGTFHIGGLYYNSIGGQDIFITKFDSTGQVVWARVEGGTGYDSASAVRVDSAGNVYMAGTFSGTGIFMGIPVTSVGNQDVFIIKYGPDGSFKWITTAGGTDQDDCGSLALDSTGNAYITGRFRGIASFGSNAVARNGATDIYIAKYNVGTASWEWARSAGTGDWDGGSGIAVDSAGYVYHTGSVQEYWGYSVHFGTKSITPFSTNGYSNRDMFLARYNPFAADWDWVNIGGGTAIDSGKCVEVDSTGSVVVSGIFEQTATFGSTTLTADPGGGAYWNNDYFIAKYSSTGNLTWIIQSGGCGYFRNHGIAIDGSDNIYLNATFDGTVNVGASTLTSVGYDNIYVARFNSSGQFDWAKQATGSYYFAAAAVAANSVGDAWLTGFWQGTATFEATTLTSSGYSSFYLAKLNSPVCSDLTVSGVTSNLPLPNNNAALTVTGQETNSGCDDLTNITAVTYLIDYNSNYSLDGGEPSAQVAIAGLISGSSTTVSASFQNAPAGTYQGIVQVDPSNSVVEVNEANNSSGTPLNVVRPDLTVTGLTFTATGTGNKTVTLTSVVNNIGTASTGGNSQVRFADSTNGNTFTNITDPVNAGSIAAGGQTNVQKVWNNVVPGTYWVRVTADPNNTVTEVSELNNEYTLQIVVP